MTDVPVVVAAPTEALPEALATAQSISGTQLVRVMLYMSLPAPTAVVIFAGHLNPVLGGIAQLGP